MIATRALYNGRMHTYRPRPHERVTVVTVTYADRWDTGLSATVASVLADPRADLVVVCNGAGESTRRRLRARAAEDAGRVEMIEFPSNRGSAPAFAAGLSAAYRRGTAVLLLDDDNPLPRGALARLDAVASATARGSRVCALACLRAVNPVHVDLRDGVPSDDLFAELRPGAFLTTDLFRDRRRARAKNDPITTVETVDGPHRVVPLPNAMWGGLFLPAPVAALGLLPPADLVLYGDDNAFSALMRAAGIPILLCLDIEITDTVDWHRSSQPVRGAMRVPRVLHTAPEHLWRIRYQNRNAAYLSVSQARSARARARLAANVVARTGMLFAAALIARRLPAFFAVAGAYAEGLRGRLGPSYPLPGATPESAATGR
ncbi:MULTISPECIES: glycosyltransferase family 2 protein [Microbacterium]|uniref:glycosyltransferase family 2 protein n=1 Tax=Microbacterium TaxID=33882 RepID=UPI002782EB9F|nr:MULTISPECIES: glycosyltransferase [Microbacterium]MDQ1075611.1 GT2 family glycosyltransferase [Microbacterium sp. SORGH_AS_0969]MDQ1115850.1 GT2 family glycosyltransferase [Microbacterium testaceum]